jgi:hypothetical protein
VTAEGWRTEADDEWLATRRSTSFARMRKRLQRLGLLGEAVSEAELGPFGGAPRRPALKIGGKAYAVVRYAEHRIAYTTVRVDLLRCRRCGHRLVESHRILFVGGDGGRQQVGTVRACRRCEADSWLFTSRMPGTVRARTWGRKVVL